MNQTVGPADSPLENALRRSFRRKDKDFLSKNRSRLKTTSDFYRKTSLPRQPDLAVKQNPVVSAGQLEKWMKQVMQARAGKEDGLALLGADTKTLRAQGLSLRQTTRLYQAIYVHSVGFTTQVQQLLDNCPRESVKSLLAKSWVLLSRALQFCGRGQYVDAVSQIQAQRREAVGVLHSQIEARKGQIKALGRRGEIERAEIAERCLVAEQELTTLQVQKQRLQEQLSQTEAAYRQEVASRLRFEGRINEISCVHQELKRKLQKSLEEIAALRKQNVRLASQLEQERGKGLAKEQEISRLRGSLDVAEGDNRVLIRNAEEYRAAARQAIQRMGAMKEGESQKSASLVSRESEIGLLRLALDDKERLARTLQEKLESSAAKIARLQQDKSEFEMRFMGEREKCSKTEILLFQLRIAQSASQSKISNLFRQIADLNAAALEAEVRRTELEAELAKTKTTVASQREEIKGKKQLLDKNAEALQNVMKQSIKDAEERDWLSLQLEQTRTKADKYCEENRVLSKELADARMKGDQLDKRIRAESSEVMDFRSKDKKSEEILVKLQDELRTLQQIQQQSLQQMERRNLQLEERNQTVEQQLRAMQSQAQDQQFQFEDLKTKYQQSLVFLRSEKDYLKEVTLQSSVFKDGLARTTRQLETTELKLAQALEDYRQLFVTAEEREKALKQVIDERAMHLHPMAYSELQAVLLQKHVKNKEIQDKLNSLVTTLSQENASLGRNCQNLQEDNQRLKDEGQLNALIASQQMALLEKTLKDVQDKAQKTMLQKIKAMLRQNYKEEAQPEKDDEVDFYVLLKQKNEAVKEAHRRAEQIQLETRTIRQNWADLVSEKQILHNQLASRVDKEQLLQEQLQELRARLDAESKSAADARAAERAELQKLKTVYEREVSQLRKRLAQRPAVQAERASSGRRTGQELSSRVALQPEEEVLPPRQPQRRTMQHYSKETVSRLSIFNKIENATRYYRGIK